MKTLCVLVMLLAGAAAPALPQGTEADGAAIRTIVNHWREMWDHFDASPLRDDYAQDADFLNAFGTRLKGQAEILTFAARVVQRPNVRDRHTTWSEPSVRFVGPDVAIASRDYTTTGHRTASGEAMAPRKTHALWVLRKDAGRWRIVSQMIADENNAS